MRKLGAVLIIGALFTVMAGYVHAAGTAEDAKAMVEKAVAYLKANGKDKAFSEFNNAQGQFVKGDLYIWVMGGNGVILSHGVSPKLIGKDLTALRDSDGKLFIKEMLEMAKTRDSGWSDYKWVNPVTKNIEAKSTYYTRNDQGIVCCGIYKK
jgi:cytochrome c